jgi:hypothetical protein
MLTDPVKANNRSLVLLSGASALALLAGCGGGTSSNARSVTATSPATAPTTAASSPTGASACALKDTGDLIAWFKAPGLEDTAQVLGSINLAKCKYTVDTFEASSPAGAGYCSALANAADNPVYNADATPAIRPKKVIVQFGGACS